MFAEAVRTFTIIQCLQLICSPALSLLVTEENILEAGGERSSHAEARSSLFVRSEEVRGNNTRKSVYREQRPPCRCAGRAARAGAAARRPAGRQEVTPVKPSYLIIFIT